MQSKIYKLLISFITSLILISLVSCTETASKENQWVVATSADNPPFQYLYNGEIVGFDIDLMNEIAKIAGKEIKYKNMEFHSLLAALASNNVDLVIAGLSVTDERKKRVDFSIPYTSSTIAVLFRRADDFKEYADLNGGVVGAQLGSVYNIIAHDLAMQCKCKVHSLSSNLMLVEELKSKRINAVILEEAQARKFIELNEGFGMFTLKEFNSAFAIAMPKGSKLKDSIDNAIELLDAQGIIRELSKKWKLIQDN